MKKPQWITASIIAALVVIVYATSINQIFGTNVRKTSSSGKPQTAIVSFDSILFHAKERLTPEQVTRLNLLENSVVRGDVPSQKIHVYHQLARFWSDSAGVFEPFAWYTAESARLVNSENSLTFAAHLFLDNLKAEGNPALKQWKALQAKDLFERSLKINPEKDSSQVGLGLVELYGGLGSPMEGIQKIRNVADKNPGNVYAQMSLGHASVTSGQLDKAVERFETVIKTDSKNLEAILSLADVYERKGDKIKAVEWYKKSLPFINVPALVEEVEKRISELSN